MRTVPIAEADLSCNQITELDTHDLPRKLQRLDVSGNVLQQLPSSLSDLKYMRSIAASCNVIEDCNAVFGCAHLVHASLCYNKLAELTCSPLSVRSAIFVHQYLMRACPQNVAHHWIERIAQ